MDPHAKTVELIDPKLPEFEPSEEKFEEISKKEDITISINKELSEKELKPQTPPKISI